MKNIMGIFVFVGTILIAFTLAQGAKRNAAVSASDKPATGTEVKIDNFSFGPATITIPAGSTVTWTNNDDIPHAVASDEMFKSKTLHTDDQFSFTFTKPGTYNYYCAIHPKMVAKVVVQ